MGILTYVYGDLFGAPRGAILVHACNAVGSWGSGIALTFRDKYPAAFEQYKAHCKQHGRELVGTCLVIPTEDRHIACLFTSRSYGKNKDSPEAILTATRTAVQSLLDQNNAKKPLHSCQFNSGRFGVPWEQTAAILEELGAEMTVYEPPDDIENK